MQIDPNLISKKPLILIVDDVPKNLQVLGGLLSQEGYRIAVATNGKQAVSMAQKIEPDIILLDVMMPEMDGYETIKHLKDHERTHHIPVLFITALTEVEDETKGLELGAVDYITKPFSLPIVKARIKTHLRLKRYQDHLEDLVRLRTAQVVETQLEIVYRLARAAEFRDNETGLHIKRLSHYCELLALKYGLSKDESHLLFHASSMHDVGKIGIPDHILLKPDRLSEKEWVTMRAHPTIGADLLDGHKAPLLIKAHIVAKTHHEKYDGTGYPAGLSTDQIPLESRITAICDVFDALTSKRPYKKAWTTDDAIAEINRQKGSYFDPVFVDLFNGIFGDILDIRNRFMDEK